MKDIPVDRAGRPMFDADGRKLSMAERKYAYRITELELQLQVSEAAHHWAIIERDKLRVENTELKAALSQSLDDHVDTGKYTRKLRTLAQSAVDDRSLHSDIDENVTVDYDIMEALAKYLKGDRINELEQQLEKTKENNPPDHAPLIGRIDTPESEFKTADAAHHWVVIERDKLREENTELKQQHEKDIIAQVHYSDALNRIVPLAQAVVDASTKTEVEIACDALAKALEKQK
jgi:hypothetical protein